MTSLRILSRKSANLSGLQRWTSSPITCKQSCVLPASGRGRAIMLMPIRIQIPSLTHVVKQNFTLYFYTQQCQFTLFYLSHHRHNFQYFNTWKSVLRIRDVYPGFWFLPIPNPGSRISDPGSKNSNKREGWKKISCHNFLCSQKFHKIAHYFSFDELKKKMWANFQRTIELLTQKIVNKLAKLWIWDPGSEIRDPGSEIRDPEKTYYGSRIQGSKRHRIPDPGSATLENFWKKNSWALHLVEMDTDPISRPWCRSTRSRIRQNNVDPVGTGSIIFFS